MYLVRIEIGYFKFHRERNCPKSRKYKDGASRGYAARINRVRTERQVFQIQAVTVYSDPWELPLWLRLQLQEFGSHSLIWGFFTGVGEELAEVKEKVRQAETGLRNSRGLQDTIKALEGITVDSIKPEWTALLTQDTSEEVQELRTVLAAQQDLLKTSLSREQTLLAKLVEICKRLSRAL